MNLRTTCILTLLFLFIVIFSTGCATRASFNYKAGPPLGLGISSREKTLAILPFEDKRTGNNRNAMLLAFIPIVPFGYSKYYEPDGANMFLTQGAYNFRPTEDFARALVQEIKINNIFTDVFYTEREQEPNVDYFITGEINETIFTGMMFTYGLSCYGSLLWIVGFPVGRTFNTVDVDIHLIRATDRKELWSHNIEGKYSKIAGYYYNWGSDFDGYPIILKDGYESAIKSLATEINGGRITSE